MKAIRDYTSTLLEFKICKARLDYLLLKREELEVRYCGVKGMTITDTGVHNQPSGADGLMKFVIAITTPDPKTGLSLDDEIEQKTNEVVTLYQTLSRMARALSQLTDIEAQLYRKIVVDGLKTSEAVRQVARDNYMSEQNIYARYYPSIKEEIYKLKKRVE